MKINSIFFKRTFFALPMQVIFSVNGLCDRQLQNCAIDLSHCKSRVWHQFIDGASSNWRLQVAGKSRNSVTSSLGEFKIQEIAEEIVISQSGGDRNLEFKTVAILSSSSVVTVWVVVQGRILRLWGLELGLGLRRILRLNLE